MGWIEIALLFAAALILAVNQGLRDATAIRTRFPWLKPRGWWNYLPLGFMLAAGVVYLAGLSMGTNRPSGNASASGDVVEGVNVATLTGFYSGRTRLEAQRLLAPYIGAPVSVNGTVRDIDEMGEERAVWLNEPASGALVLVYLSEPQRQFAERLRPGDRIAGRCHLRSALQESVSLYQCSFPNAPQWQTPATNSGNTAQ